MSIVTRTLVGLLLALTSIAVSAQGWMYEPKKDPISDAERSFVGTESVSGDSILVVRCDPDGMNVMVLHETIISTDAILGIWRFDDHEAEGPAIWDPSYNKTAAYLPLNGVADFVEKMKQGTKVAIRLYSEEGRPFTSVYSLMGFTRQYQKLECKPGSSV